MKKILFVLLFLIFPLISPVFAQNLKGQDFPNKDYRLGKNEVVNQDLFVAGDNVEIRGTVNGDLYATGKNITVDGRINGDLLAAGASVNVSGNIVQDARIAGGNIIISGRIGKNASLIGGNITLSNTSVVYGGLSTVFGNLTESASIGRYLKGTGGNINISNYIGGNVDLAVNSLTVSASSQILGNISYWSKDRGSIDKDARITGRTIFNKSNQYPPIADSKLKNTVLKTTRLGSFIYTYILGLIILLLFPAFSNKVVNNIKERTLTAFLFGLVSPIIVVVACFLLIITLVGIPLSIFIFLIYLLFLYLSRIPLIYYLGKTLTEKINIKENTVWSFTFGILVYWILTLIPVISIIVKVLTLGIGAGAFLLAFKAQKVKAILPRQKRRLR